MIAAATLNNAVAYNLMSDYGTLEVGKVANLLLLDASPLETIEAYNTINSVVLRGEAIKRAHLHIDALQQAAP